MTEWIITSSLLILLIAALRKLLRGKISLRLQYALWAIVLLRLLLPFSLFESRVSVMNLIGSLRSVEIVQTAEEISDYEDLVFDAVPSLSAGISPEYETNPGNVYVYPYGDSDRNYPTTVLTEVTGEEFEQLEKVIKLRDVLIPLWLAGCAAVLGVFTVSNLRFAARLRRSRGRKLGDSISIIPVYVSSAIDTPCLFGLFSPTIYVTPQCEANPAVLRHVVSHETTHYRHGDNLWALLRCVAIALHWYNPLVWWAAFMSRNDAELSCDEGTLRRLGQSEQINYGRTLIGLTCTRGNFSSLAITATTMTGSKKSIKERITFIAKKPKMAIYTLLAVIIVAAVAVGCTFSGADSGFSNRDARKESKALAESVAFENYYELDGKPEILRYEGGPCEADPGVNKQYVRVSYHTKNSLREIVVEFCMTDDKGQHYDEPFSASSWLSHSHMQIVPSSADRIERVQIWKNGYPNPVIPGAYVEEIKEYMPHFFYGEPYPTGIKPEGVNDTGFTVFLADGSSVSFGIDWAAQNGIYYKVISPELPEWLTQILEAPGKMEMEYDEHIRVNDAVKAKVDPAIIELAVDRVRRDLELYVRDWGLNIIDAELSALENITTGAADQHGNAIDMYRLEYRLRPDDIDSVVLVGGMKIEDGCITEWGSVGQPYIMVYLQDGKYTGLSKNITTESLDIDYSSDEKLDRYGNKYTAAAMEFLYMVMGDYEYDWYVMMQTGGTGIPPYYHFSWEETYTEHGWLSADGTPLNFEKITVPTFSISDAPPEGWTELAISCNNFIGRSQMQVYTEGGELLRLYAYEAEDLYALDPGSYYVTFDINVPGDYIAEEMEFERSGYTCVFRLEVTPNEEGAFYFGGDAESLVKLYAEEVYAKEMLSAEGEYAITDYKLLECMLYAESVDGSEVIGEMRYAFTPSFLDSWGGNVRPAEGEAHGMLESYYHFTLTKCGNNYWKCTDMGTGGAGGWGYIWNWTAEMALNQALAEMKDPTVDNSYLLWWLPLINFSDMDTDDFFSLMDAVEEVCVGEGLVYSPEEWRTWANVYPDDQFYRNMYCMKAALNCDGGFSARMQYILNKQRHHDEELYERCLQYFSEEEREYLRAAADDNFF